MFTNLLDPSQQGNHVVNLKVVCEFPMREHVLSLFIRSIICFNSRRFMFFIQLNEFTGLMLVRMRWLDRVGWPVGFEIAVTSMISNVNNNYSEAFQIFNHYELYGRCVDVEQIHFYRMCPLIVNFIKFRRYSKEFITVYGCIFYDHVFMLYGWNSLGN